METLKIKPYHSFLTVLIICFPLSFFFGSAFVNLILFLISINYLAIKLKKKELNFNLKNNVNYLFLFFVLLIFFTFYYQSSNFSHIIKSIVLLKFYLLFVAVKYFFRNKLYFKKEYLLHITFVILAIFIFDIYFQYIFNKNIIGISPGMCDQYDNCKRFSGIFGDEFIAGGFISTVLISFFLFYKRIFNYKILFYIPFFLFLTILVTGERSALLLIFFFMIIFYFFELKHLEIKKKLIILIVFLISLGSFTLYFLTDSTKDRYTKEISLYFKQSKVNEVEKLKNKYTTSNSEPKNENFLNKLLSNPWGSHYLASIEIFKEKFVIGGGIKSFRYRCPTIESKIDTKFKACSTHPHNFHFEAILDVGLIGYFFFVLFLLKSLGSNFNQLRLNQYIPFFFLIIFIFLPRPTGSIFSTTFGSFFWYTLAVGLSLIENKKENK